MAIPSISVSRLEGTVVVTVVGVLDHLAMRTLHHILEDLMLGQGNLYVQVDFDVLAESSVLVVLGRIQQEWIPRSARRRLARLPRRNAGIACAGIPDRRRSVAAPARHAIGANSGGGGTPAVEDANRAP